MRKLGVPIFILGFLFLFSWGTNGMAADFPQKPIRVIIPFSAGGGVDVLCRAFQPFLEKVLGQRILVENIPAGTTKVATLELMKAKPDGYTLIFNNMMAWVNYYYSGTFDYKAWEQMTPIGTICSVPYGFVEVRAESFNTWADLVKAAKENPGKLTCAGPGAGGMMELIMNKITQASGIKTRYVPFAGSAPGKVALLGGHVDFRICHPAESIEMIRAGKTRGLAVSTDKRMEALPDVPTFKELGIWGTVTGDLAFWGPPKLPSNLADTLTKMIEKAAKDPEFIKIARDQLLYTMNYQPPEKVKADLQNYNNEIGPLLKEMYK